MSGGPARTFVCPRWRPRGRTRAWCPRRFLANVWEDTKTVRADIQELTMSGSNLSRATQRKVGGSLFMELVLVQQLTHNSRLLGCEGQHTKEWEFWCNSCLARTVCRRCTLALRDSATPVPVHRLIFRTFTWRRCVIEYAAENRSSFWCAPGTAIGLSQKAEWTRTQPTPTPPHGKPTKKLA